MQALACSVARHACGELDWALCVLAGIGRSITRIDQIDMLQRPLSMEDGGVVLMDLLWSDPPTNDGVEGVQPSPRGPGLVTFGPDRVKEFCKVGRSGSLLGFKTLRVRQQCCASGAARVHLLGLSMRGCSAVSLTAVHVVFWPVKAPLLQWLLVTLLHVF